jgi:hypothetical protein
MISFTDNFRGDLWFLSLQLDLPGSVEAVAMEERVHLCQVKGETCSKGRNTRDVKMTVTGHMGLSLQSDPPSSSEEVARVYIFISEE